MIDGTIDRVIDREIDRTALQFIAIDMDGNILDDSYRLSDRVVAVLATLHTQGKKIIIATGRIFMAAQHYLIEKIEPDRYVCTNCADIFEPKGVQIAAYHIPPQAVPVLIELGRAHEVVAHEVLMCCYISDQWFYEKPLPAVEFYQKRTGIQGLQRNIESFEGEDILKFLAIGPHEEILAIRDEHGRKAPTMFEIIANSD